MKPHSLSVTAGEKWVSSSLTLCKHNFKSLFWCAVLFMLLLQSINHISSPRIELMLRMMRLAGSENIHSFVLWQLFPVFQYIVIMFLVSVGFILGMSSVFRQLEQENKKQSILTMIGCFFKDFREIKNHW